MQEVEKNYIHDLDEKDYVSELIIGIAHHYGVDPKTLLDKNALLVTKERIVNPVLLYDGDVPGEVRLMLQPKTVMNLDASASSYFMMTLMLSLRRIIAKERKVDESSVSNQDCLERMELENNKLVGHNAEASFCSTNIKEEYLKGGRMELALNKMIKLDGLEKDIQDTLEGFSNLELSGKEVSVSEQLKLKIEDSLKDVVDETQQNNELMNSLDSKIVVFEKFKKTCDEAKEEHFGLNGTEVFKKEDISIETIRKIFKEKGPMAVQEELERLTPDRREEILKQLL